MNNQRIIPSTELARMRISGGPLSTKLSQASQLKAMSVARVSKWANTIDAARKLVSKQREERLLKEEEERRQQDLREAQIQFEERRAVIERANALVMSDNERTRTLTSAMMLCDVLAERDNQIRIKAHMDKLDSIRNVKYEQLSKHNHAQIGRREERAEREARLRRVETALEQKDQIREVEDRYRDELNQKRIEKTEVLGVAMSYEKSEMERRQQIYEKAVRLNSDSQKAQELMEDLKMQDEILADAELKDIQEYARHKEVMAAKIKARQTELIIEPIEKRKKMSQSVHHQALRSGRHSIGPETEATSLPMTSNDDRKLLMRKLQSFVVEENRRTIEKKSSMHIASEVEKLESADDVIELTNELDEMHMKILDDKNSAIQNLSEDLLRKKNAKYPPGEGLGSSNVTPEDAIAREGSQFQRHAESVRSEYASEGKNIAPLVIAERKYRKNPNL